LAFKAAIAALFSKLLFTCFILYVAIPQIIKGQLKLFWIILQVAVASLIAILLHRIVFVYYINPVIYLGVLKNRPLFNLLGVLLAVMDIGFVSGIAITLKLLRIQLTTREREKNLIKEKLEAELKFLRHQTNPHFLFNTLNNIYALARKKSEHTAEVVLRLSKLLRFMLYESKSDLISISDELKILDDYIALEKMRYERLTIHFQRDIDDSLHKIAPLLLLPFVENAFKHGVNAAENSDIRIEVDVTQHQLHFTAFNNKVTIQEMPEDKGGLGIVNTRKRLELLYPGRHTLEIIDDPNYFSVSLLLKLT
jgi:LytS/YehU family sensor histidine kinase